jgi:hypothetical protein
VRSAIEVEGKRSFIGVKWALFLHWPRASNRPCAGGAVPKESKMRLLVSTILTIGMMLVAAPGRAQTYDPNYPVCLQTYAIGGGSIDCSFTSLTQCAASASGRAAQCLNNPYFAQRDRKPSRRRGVY